MRTTTFTFLGILCCLAARSAHAQDCAIDLPEALDVCENAPWLVDWSIWGVDAGEWVGVEWTDPSGQTDSTGTDTGPALFSPGSWSFSFYGAAGDTCLASIEVNLVPAPTAAFTAMDGVCGNDGVAFTNVTTGGIGTAHSWDFGDGTPASTAVNPVHFYALPGGGSSAVNVTLTSTNSDGSCPSSVTVPVSVLQVPTPNFTTAAPLCQSDANWPNYTLTIPPAPGAVAWNLDWGNGTDTSFVVPGGPVQLNTSFDTFGTYDLTLTVEAANGCANEIVVPLFVGSNPTIGTTNPGNTTGLCVPADLVFSITGFANNVEGTTYTIEYGDGTSAVYNHPPPSEFEHTYWSHSCNQTTPEGSNNALRFKVTASNQCGTSISTHDPIRLHETPDPELQGPQIVCTGSEDYQVIGGGLEVNAVNCVPSDIYWTVDAISPGGAAGLNFGFGDESGVTFYNQGLYEVSVYDLHDFCPDGQDTLEVCAIPAPQATAALSALSGCAPMDLTITSGLPDPLYCGSYVYQWTVSGGAYAFADGTHSGSTSPHLTLLDQGTYTISQTVSVPGAACSSASNSYQVVVYETPSIAISSGGIACENDDWTVQVLSYDAGGSLNPSFYWIIENEVIYSPINEPVDLFFDDNGIWNINAFLTNACGTASAQANVFVNGAPALTPSAPASGCVGEGQVVSVTGGQNLAWSPEPVSVNLAGNQATFVLSADEVITVTGYAEYPELSCSTVVEVPLFVDPLPVLTFPDLGQICSGQPLLPQPFVQQGTPGYVYDWVYGTQVAAGPNPLFTAVDGVEAMTLTVTDSNGCTDAATASVDVLPLPFVDAGLLDGFCDQSIDTTLASGTPLGGSWSGPGITADGTLNPGALGIGSWEVTYTYIDEAGCANSDDLSVVVFAPLFADAGPDLSFCDVDSNVVFTGFSPLADGTWSGPGVVNPSSGAVNLSGLTPGLHTFTFAYGTGTCATSDDRLVEIWPNPTAVLNAVDLTVCDGDLAVVNLAGTGGAGGYEYAWESGSSWDVSSPQSASVTVAFGTPAVISATVLDANGCTGTDTLEVTVLELPAFIILDTLVACNQPIVEDLPDIIPVGGAWSGTGVLSPGGAFDPSVAGLGDAPITYTFTDSEGCTNSIATIAQVIEPTFAVAGPGAWVCDVDTTIQLADFGPVGGTWSGVGLDAAGVWQAGPLAPGDYEATYTIGEASCQTAATVNLAVLARPELELLGPAEACWGDSVHFTASVSGGAAPYAIEWVGGPLGNEAGFLPDAPGLFVVGAFVTDANGCAEYAEANTVVHALPVVDAGEDVTFCDQPIAEDLTGAFPTPGIYSGSLAVTASGSFDPSVSGVGLHPVVYTHTDPVTGCFASDTLVVEVILPTYADAGPDLTVCLNDGEMNLEAATSGSWSAPLAAGLLDAASGLVDPGLAGAGVHAFVLSAGGGSCLTQDTMALEVLALPALTLVAASSWCVNDSVVELPEALPAGGTWTGTGLVAGSSPQAFDALVGVGVWDLAYAYTDPLTGCVNQTPHQVTILGLPTVSAGPDVILCDQPILEQLTGAMPSSLTGLGNAYYGLGGAATAVTAGGLFDPSISGVGTFEVVYAYTSATTGCVGRDTLVVSVSDPVIAEAGMDVVACANAPLLTLTGFFPESGGNWFTDVAGNLPSLVDPVAGVIDPQGLAPGDHTFYFENGSGTCYTKDSLEVHIDALPALLLGPDDVFCLNDTTMPLAAVSPVGGTWEGTGVIGTNFNTLVGAGGYDLIYWYEDAVTGCRDTTEHHVTVQPLPVVEAGPDLTLCNQPIPEQLVGESPVDGNGGTGVFFGLGGAAAAVTSDGVFDPSVSGTGTFEVVYSFTSSATNCTQRDTLIVTVVEPVVAFAGTDSVVCANAPLLTLEGYFPTSGATWSGIGAAATGLVNSTAGWIDPQLLAPGSYTFQIEVGSGTCYSSDVVELVVDPLPVLALGSDDVFCLNDTLMPLTDASPLGGTWEGTGVEGLNFNTLVGAGTYDLIYWYESPVTGCRDTAQHEVLVNGLPTVEAGWDLVLCDQPISEELTGFSPTAGGSGAFYGIGALADAAISADGTFEPSISGVGAFEVVYGFTSAATGCGQTDTLTIVVNPPVFAEAGLDTTVCANAPWVALEGFSPTADINWFSTNGFANAAVVNPAAGTIDPQALLPGAHTFTVEYGAGTCYTRDSLVMHVDALPQLELGAPDAWCGNDGEVEVAEALPLDGTWFGPGILEAATGLFDTDQVPGDYAPGYTYTDPLTGCADTAFHAVTIHAVPVADFTADGLGCTNLPLPIAQESTGAVAAFWWFGDGDVSYAWEPAHTFDDPGFYTVTMQASSEFGCKDTLEQAVQITTPPTATATLTPSSGCAPLDVAFDNSSTAPFATFEWQIGTALTTAFEPLPMSFAQGDTLVIVPVSLTVTNLCATSVWESEIEVFPAPQLAFSLFADTACSPYALEVLNTSSGMPDVLTWNMGNGVTHAGYQPPATLYTTGDDPADFVISLVGVNECGTDSVVAAFHLKPNTVSAFFEASTVAGCAPLSVDFTDLSTNTTSIAFDFGNGLASFDSLANTTYTNPGDYEIQQFVTNGCAFDTIGLSVTVFEEPEFTLSTNAASHCVGEPVNFTVEAATSGSADWAFGNGEAGTGFFATTTYANSGTFWAVAEVSTALFACTAEDSVAVQVLPAPQWALTGPDPGCAPFEVTFENATANALFIAWDFGDNSAPSVDWEPTHTYFNSGLLPVTYEVSVHAESAAFCAADTVIEVSVLPVPQAEIALASQVSCEVPVNVEVADASTGALTSTWWFNGQIASAGTTPSLTADAVGDHEIVLQATNGYGCSDLDTATFTVLPQPVPALDVFPLVGCQILPVTFDNQSAGASTTQLNLTGPSGSIYSGPMNGTAVIDLEEAGWYTAQFSATSPEGCIATLDVPQLIQVYPTPVAAFAATPLVGTAEAIDPLNETWTFESNSIGASILNWNFGDGAIGGGSEVSHTYANAGSYFVTLTAANEFGCIDQRVEPVLTEALLQVFVPNAFTPPSLMSQASGTGSRGLNDAFRPVFSKLDLVAEYELTIFNRWGDVVFHSVDPHEFWVGEAVRDGAHYAEDDVYVWTLYYQPTYEDIGVRKQGHVTLIRD